MPSVYAFSADEVPDTPWPSGHGSSCELALWPDGSSLAAADFTLRVSLDQVDRAGALPSLPGYDHVVTALGASGLHLSHGEDAPDTHLRRAEAGSLNGDWTTLIEAVESPTWFLSVCTRRGRARTTLQTMRLGERDLREPHASQLGLLFVSRGALTARAPDEEDPFELYAGDGVFIADGRAGDEWALEGATPDAEFVWAQIDVRA